MAKKLYLIGKKRIIQLENAADEKFWDERWDIKNNNDSVKNILDSTSRLVVEKTKEYLKKKSKILEGGCGMGDKVYNLKKAGFDSYGIDYATNTVKFLNENHPDLNIVLGDVRKLPFKNSSFDGYWSLGVIEHFFDGYDDISDEMFRVLKKGGYLFLTVPTFSMLRKIKAFFGFYKRVDSSYLKDKNFYQYLISKEELIKDFESKGFESIEYLYRGGIRGLIEELGIKIKTTRISEFKNIQTRKKSIMSILLKIITNFLNRVLKNFSPHTVLLVFRKK